MAGFAILGRSSARSLAWDRGGGGRGFGRSFAAGLVVWVGGKQQSEAVHLFAQAEQFEFFQAVRQRFRFDLAEVKARRQLQGNIQQDAGQHPRMEGTVPAGFQLGAQGPFLLAEVGEYPLQIAVGLQQIDGGFGAHSLNPGYVVGRVAGEGLEVDHIFWGHAELGDDSLTTHLDGTAVLGVRPATHIENSDIAVVIN